MAVTCNLSFEGPVVQKLTMLSTENHYPVDCVVCFLIDTNPLDSNSSGG